MDLLILVSRMPVLEILLIKILALEMPVLVQMALRIILERILDIMVPPIIIQEISVVLER